MEFYQVMLKNTLSIAAATIAVVASTSLPAAAVGGLPGQTQSVPEPATILGTLAVGSMGLLATKKKTAVSNEEQK